MPSSKLRAAKFSNERIMSHASPSKFIGARVERAEDNELLSGKGVFVDDIDFPGMLHAYVVRSVHARAKILRIDTGAAKRSPGVVDVITFEDLGAVRKLPLTIPHPNLKPLTEFPLAKDQVRYVGEPVAVIVATRRAIWPKTRRHWSKSITKPSRPASISKKRWRRMRRWCTKANRTTSRVS